MRIRTVQSAQFCIRKSNGFLFTLGTATLTLAVLVGCNSKPADQPKLRISMIPTTDPSKALRENQPLLAYWQKQTGQTPDLTIPTSYAAVVEALANNKVDIAYLGGLRLLERESVSTFARKRGRFCVRRAMLEGNENHTD